VALDVGYRARTIVTENFNLKILSLGFALLLYSLVHGSQEAQRSLMLNVVTFTPGDAQNRELVTPIPAQIRDIGSVHVDLRGGNETRWTFDPTTIPVPPGLQIEQIDPPAIDLTWEDRITRDVPVEVGIVGTPAPGFVVKGVPVADPEMVRARGAKSEVMVVQHARADAFDVTGLTAGKYARQLAVDRPPGRVTYDASSISATTEIGREVAERLFARVPVATFGHLAAKTQPAEVDVRLTCPPEVVRALRPEQIVPRVQATGPTDHGSEVLPVELTIDQCEVHLTPSTVIARW
jgi:hypothetical protein